MQRLKIASCAVLLVMSGFVSAADRKVNDSAGLAGALKEAAAGDRIVVAPGEYILSATVTLGPLTIEAADGDGRPVLKPGEGAFILDAGDVEGTVLIRNVVFEGDGREVGALQTLGTRLEVEACEFRNFSGKSIVRSGAGPKNRDKLRGIRVSRCVFRKNPKGAAVGSLGPALVEDCTLENITGGLSFDDWTGKWGHKPRRDYKVVVRRNHIYRTEGTDWKCHGLTTRTTAPEVYGNVLHDLSKGNCMAMTIASNGFDREGTPTAAEVYRNVIIEKWKAADSGYIHEGIEYGEYRPTKGRIYENVLVGHVSPSLYNKGDENEWFNNTLVMRNWACLYHCYGLRCRYYNHLQVGGGAGMNNQAAVDKGIAEKWLSEGCTSEDHSLEYSCLWKAKNSFIKGEGCFEADPKFVDPDGMDFHLRFDSPCINKGTGSRDGLTPTDIGAYEYPIQVSHFTVDDAGVATWAWSNEFQKVSRLVRIRWHAARFPESHDAEGDATVAEVPAALTKTPTGKRSGYFAAFVQDVKGRWSAATPDDVHRFALDVGRK